MTPNENWSEYRRMILKFCEETKSDIDDLRQDIKSLQDDTLVMKTRWTIITAIVGFLAGLVPVLLQIFFTK